MSDGAVAASARYARTGLPNRDECGPRRDGCGRCRRES
jgi:hypothetical protein